MAVFMYAVKYQNIQDKNTKKSNTNSTSRSHKKSLLSKNFSGGKDLTNWPLITNWVYV